jgi:DNA replication protein DnaC
MSERLDAVLAHLGRLIETRAQETSEQAQLTRAIKERTEREDFLQRERISLKPHVRHALIHQEPLLHTPSLIATREWLKYPKQPTLVLAGGTGCGKSVAAAAAALVRRKSARWRNATGLVRLFASLFGTENEREDLMRVSMLVIDDVGFEPETGRLSAALVELLERRGKDSATLTIITTNGTREALDEHYQDERLSSRWHPTQARWAYSDGLDLRRQPP